MAVDTPTPLCEWEDCSRGAFSDLARGYTDPDDQNRILCEATRLIEQITDRRLVPFTGHTETCRATGVDPDEYPLSGSPVSIASALGQSYAGALGSDDGVRHVWLREYAARYPEMWRYTDVSVQVVNTYGGTTQAGTGAGTPVQVIGAEVDTGHLWFPMGAWVPLGSTVRMTYGGGYDPIPADLVRAGKLMTAAIIMRELIPNKQTRDPRALWEEAALAAAGYGRD